MCILRSSYFAVLILLLPTHSVFALDSKYLFNFSMDFGGDKLLDLTYNDGSKSDITSGDGILLGGGAAVELYSTESFAFDFQPSLSWKFTTIQEASNGNATWTRFPADMLLFFRDKKNSFRIGAGLTHHMMNKLDGEGVLSQATQEFDNTLGYIIQADYMLDYFMSFDLRYTAISYSSDTVSAVNANSIGVGMSFFFD